MLTAVAFAIAVVALPSLSRAQLASSAWPMLGHDPSHSGQSQFSTSSNDGKRIWAFQTENWPAGPPSIAADGTLYVCGADQNLYAVNTDGTGKWKIATSCYAPAIGADGTIYSAGATSLNAFTDGGQGIVTQKWSATDIGGALMSPAIGADGTIYFSDSHGNLLAETDNGASATQKWKFETSEDLSSPAIGADGTIYVEDGESVLHAVNADGTEKWETTLALTNGFPAQPSIGPDGTIYALPTSDDSVDAFTDGGQGAVTEKWSTALEGKSVGGMAIGSDGTIYLGVTGVPAIETAPFGSSKHGFKNDLVAFNADGTQKWQVVLAKTSKNVDSIGEPAIGADGTIYLADNSTLYAVSSVGQQKWKYSLLAHGKFGGISGPSSPVIGADGTIYIGAAVGNDKKTYPLYALGSKKK